MARWQGDGLQRARQDLMVDDLAVALDMSAVTQEVQTMGSEVVWTAVYKMLLKEFLLYLPWTQTLQIMSQSKW